MTKAEMISALYEIKKTCSETKRCIDCPFFKDREGTDCGFDGIFTTINSWQGLSYRSPEDWNIESLEG